MIKIIFFIGTFAVCSNNWLFSCWCSASFLRKAWLRSGQNYLAPNGEWYAAIRVPQASNPRLLKNADLNGFSMDNLKEIDHNA